MKLSNMSLCTVDAAHEISLTILEDGEGPRWKFNYRGKQVTDPFPDILMLGAYQHPSTGNNLVGGVNLHYLNKQKRDELARALPEIMKQNNLKERYRLGERLLPEIFKNAYRTYDAKYIRGVRKDTLYPKYGWLKTAQKWLTKKLGGVTKPKAQRQREAEPEYPTDLQAMQDKLDQAVLQLSQEPPPEEPPDSPEMKAARQAYQDFRRQKTMRDIERQEDEPFLTAQQDLERAYQEPGIQDPERYEVEETPLEAEPTPDELGDEIELERQARQRELSDPDNEIDPDVDLRPQSESIIYEDVDWENDLPLVGDMLQGLHVLRNVPNVESIDATFLNYHILDGIRKVPMSYFGGPKSVHYAADDFQRSRRLADQIRKSGRISPLIIAIDAEGPYILEGAHRYVALHYLGFRYLPALVVIDEDNVIDEYVAYYSPIAKHYIIESASKLIGVV